MRNAEEQLTSRSAITLVMEEAVQRALTRTSSRNGHLLKSTGSRLCHLEATCLTVDSFGNPFRTVLQKGSEYHQMIRSLLTKRLNSSGARTVAFAFGDSSLKVESASTRLEIFKRVPCSCLLSNSYPGRHLPSC